MAATSKHSCVARAHSDMLSVYMAGLTSLPEAAMLAIYFLRSVWATRWVF